MDSSLPVNCFDDTLISRLLVVWTCSLGRAALTFTFDVLQIIDVETYVTFWYRCLRAPGLCQGGASTCILLYLVHRDLLVSSPLNLN